MATWTVIRNSLTGDSVDVVIEFPIPAGANSAGVEWRRVVLELYNIRSDPGEFIPSINHRKYRDSNYTMKLLGGEVIELALTIPLTPSDTNAAKKATIETAVALKVTEFTAEFAQQYKFYGLTGVV